MYAYPKCEKGEKSNRFLSLKFLNVSNLILYNQLFYIKYRLSPTIIIVMLL